MPISCGLFEDIVYQGSTVNKPDILAVTAAFKPACQRRVEQGQRVNYFGMMDFFPRIKGVFSGPTDSFYPARQPVGAWSDIVEVTAQA